MTRCVAPTLRRPTTSLTGGDGEDTLEGRAATTTLNGGNDDDTLVGAAGDDVLSGGNGDDLLRPGVGNGSNTGGADGVAGGAHDNGDTVSWAGTAVAVTADIDAGSATGAGINQSLASVENLTGDTGNDTFAAWTWARGEQHPHRAAMVRTRSTGAAATTR